MSTGFFQHTTYIFGVFIYDFFKLILLFFTQWELHVVLLLLAAGVSGAR